MNRIQQTCNTRTLNLSIGRYFFLSADTTIHTINLYLYLSFFIILWKFSIVVVVVYHVLLCCLLLAIQDKLQEQRKYVKRAKKRYKKCENRAKWYTERRKKQQKLSKNEMNDTSCLNSIYFYSHHHFNTVANGNQRKHTLISNIYNFTSKICSSFTLSIICYCYYRRNRWIVILSTYPNKWLKCFHSISPIFHSLIHLFIALFFYKNKKINTIQFFYSDFWYRKHEFINLVMHALVRGNQINLKTFLEHERINNVKWIATHNRICEFIVSNRLAFILRTKIYYRMTMMAKLSEHSLLLGSEFFHFYVV